MLFFPSYIYIIPYISQFYTQMHGAPANKLTLVGEEEEVGLLVAQWSAACTGESGTV